MKQSDFSRDNPIHPDYKGVNAMDSEEYKSFVMNKIHWELNHCKQQMEEIQDRKRKCSDELNKIKSEISKEESNYKYEVKCIKEITKLLNISPNVDADVEKTSFAKGHRSRMNDLSLKENECKRKVDERANELADIENKIKFWQREIDHFQTPIVKKSYSEVFLTFLQGAAYIFFGSFLTACTLGMCHLNKCTLFWIADYLCFGCEEIGCGLIPLGETPIIPVNTILFYLIIVLIASRIYYKNYYENVEDRIQ